MHNIKYDECFYAVMGLQCCICAIDFSYVGMDQVEGPQRSSGLVIKTDSIMESYLVNENQKRLCF